MKRIAVVLCTLVGLVCSASNSQAGWGSLCYSGYQPWWNIFAKRYKCLTPEEERLQKFWHDYYHALKEFYCGLDAIDSNDRRPPEFLAAFRGSLWLGILSSTIAIGLAVPAALAIARYRFPGREAVTALFLSPLMVPHVVLGIAFLRFFSQIGLSGTFLGLVLSHVIVVVPFALRLVLATSYGIDTRIEQAAVSLGADVATTFRRVTLPLLLPGIVSGWVLAFINSFDEVTMTVFIASPATTTLPVRLFLYIQDNIDPLVCSISASLIALTAILMIALDRLFGLDRLFLGAGKA